MLKGTCHKVRFDTCPLSAFSNCNATNFFECEIASLKIFFQSGVLDFTCECNYNVDVGVVNRN